MKYIFKKTIEDKNSTSGSRIEEVEAILERWVWGIVYKDGTEFKQFGDDGIFHQIGEINQDQIAMAVLYKPEDPENKRIDIPWKDGMKIIHKYRNLILNAGTEDEIRHKVYIFGYKNGDQYHFNYILPDDRIIMSPTDDVDVTLFELK